MSGVVDSARRLTTGAQKEPKYNTRQAEDAQRRAAELQSKFGVYGVDSSLGGVRTVQQDDGTFKRVFTDSDADVQRNRLISQGLSGISLDPTQAQDVYYQQATRQLIPQQQRDAERLDANLINRGIGIGTEQYDQATGDLRNQQAGVLSDIAANSVSAGQGYLNNQISNIGALTGQRDIGALPSLGGSTGASFQETYTPYFNQKRDRILRKNEQNKGFLEDLTKAAMFATGGGN